MDLEQKAIERVRTASQMSFALYGSPLVVTDSGGKDSCVCREIVRRSGIPYEVQHNLTTADAPQTIYYVRDTFRRLEEQGVPCKINYPVYKGVKYPGISRAFKDSGGWSQENREWARAFRGAGDWYELYGIKGGSLDFSYGTSGGFYINDVVVNAQSLTIPDNGSSMPIVYMSQSGGQPWSNVPFGGGTIATSGCSVTSLAMVLSYLKSDVDSAGWIYPSDMVAAIAKKYGNYNRFYVGDGQSWDIFPAVARMFQVSCNAISSASIIRELAAGKPVIMSCKPSEFTSKGHFIVLSGLTEDGYVMVNDPNAAHASYSYKKYSISYLLSCGKGWWSFSI